jgi:hypothetical protein
MLRRVFRGIDTPRDRSGLLRGRPFLVWPTLTVPAGSHLGHKSLLFWLSGFQKRPTRMNILAKSDILFVYISPSVKMCSATYLARLPEISAPL